MFDAIFVDNKIQRGVQLHKLWFNLNVPRILEIGLSSVKTWEKNWRVLIYVVSQQLLLKFVPNENFRLLKLS